MRVSGSLNATAGISSDFKYLTTSILAYFNFSLVQSHIGQFDLGAVSDLVQFVLKDVAIPIFDKEFKGVPLPALGDGWLIAPALAHLSTSCASWRIITAATPSPPPSARALLITNQ